MIYINSNRSRVILFSKKKLEDSLNIKISNKGKIIIIEGSPEEEYLTEKVINAINLGFSIDEALILKDEETMLEIIEIKNFSRTKNLERIRARIIGTKGKTLKTLSKLTNCSIILKDNKIGLIGYNEDIENISQALKSLIKGAKTANVYAYLEKHHPLPILDFGLKPEKKKKIKDNKK